MTKQRQVILDELRKSKRHPSADEIYRLARRRLPAISLGTVYRNLRIMADRGLIRVVDSAGLPRRFDGDVGEHYHVECIDCGNVIDLLADRLRNIDEAIRDQCPYEIVGHKLSFRGLCPSCRQARASSGS
jgi:Fur family ferric uptake transcriptional regulator